MKNVKLIVLIISLFFPIKMLLAQIEIAEEDHNFALNRKVDEKVYCRTKTNENLKEGNYYIKFKEGNQPLSFWFSILPNGEIHGELKVRIGHSDDNELLGLLNVKKGVVERYRLYSQYNTKLLSAENYKKGDTIIMKYYTKKGILESESRKIKGKEIYRYECESCLD